MVGCTLLGFTLKSRRDRSYSRRNKNLKSGQFFSCQNSLQSLDSTFHRMSAGELVHLIAASLTSQSHPREITSLSAINRELSRSSGKIDHRTSSPSSNTYVRMPPELTFRIAKILIPNQLLHIELIPVIKTLSLSPSLSLLLLLPVNL